MSQLVYAHTVEGLFFRALKGKIPPALKTELLGLGLDLDGKPKDLERERWQQMLAAAVKMLWPTLPAEEAYFRLGRTAISGYEDTVMGKALLGMMRLLGPLRTVRRVMVNLQNGNSYSEATHKELAPNRHEVWTNECNGSPAYLRGILFAALEKSGAKNLKVEVMGFDGHAASFAVAWD